MLEAVEAQRDAARRGAARSTRRAATRCKRGRARSRPSVTGCATSRRGSSRRAELDDASGQLTEDDAAAEAEVEAPARRLVDEAARRTARSRVASARCCTGSTLRGARGVSSAGRAPALQAGGRRFDPGTLHSGPVQLPRGCRAIDSTGTVASGSCGRRQAEAQSSASGRELRGPAGVRLLRQRPSNRAKGDADGQRQVVDGFKRKWRPALTKALTFQSPVARNNLERLRRVHPDATPTELAKRVTRYYLSLVTTSGGAMGAAGRSPVGVSHLRPSMSSLSRRRPFFTH